MKKIIWTLYLLIFVSCLSSCTDGGVGISPFVYFGLLDKVKDFLAFCCFVLDSPQYFHGQFISRIYYAYYTLARIMVINNTSDDLLGSHERVWKQILNKTIENKYGSDLKKMRVKYDYKMSSSSNSLEQLEELLFVKTNKDLLPEQIKRIEETLEKNPMLTSEDDEVIKEKLTEIREAHDNLILKVENKIAELRRNRLDASH